MTETKEPPIVFLSGERVYLRPLELSDAAACQRWFNDPQTRRFLRTVRPINETSEREFIENSCKAQDQILFAVALCQNDRLIGSTGLVQISWTDRNAIFGITIGEPEHRNQGYGTEITRLVLCYAFETLNLHRVGLDVYARNVAGIRAYEKAGFVREGVLREAHFCAGEYCDIYRYGILAREYFAADCLLNPTSGQQFPSQGAESSR